MSKQSRAKSRARRESHAKRKSQGTGATVAFARTIRYMPEAERFHTKSTLMDELHKSLCDRRTFDTEFLSLFYCHLWSDLEMKLISMNSSSKNRMKALDLVTKIKAFYDYYM